MAYEYGNARVAGMRGRLLDRQEVTQLAQSADAFAFLALLEASPDWTRIVREVAPLGAEPAAAADAAIERQRGERLGSLPALYDGGARRLVEAVVMSLDAERLLAVMRLRRAGLGPEAIGASIVRGALLDAEMLGRIARAPGPATAIGIVARAGLLEHADQAPLAAAATATTRPETFEALLVAALDRSRERRARGWGSGPRLVRWVLERERADRAAALEELVQNGAVAASLVERALALGRYDDFAARGRRDALGIGTVIGYVAAVEAQAIRLRAALIRVRARWSMESFGAYVSRPDGRTGGRQWPAWSS